jgi:hypothetical protein
MSKPFNKKPIFIEKGIYNSVSIPDILNDKITALASAGEYGKLEQELANYNTELSKSNNLLHSIIQSQLTDIQKTEVIKLLLKRGIAINTLDDSGLPPIYYAIKSQSYNVTKLLIERKANLNIKLPKGYDLFRTSLIPSMVECPVELRDIHSNVDVGKYYAEISELERNLRIEILKLNDINIDFITKLSNYIKNYQNISLNYDNNDIPTQTFNTNILETNIKDILPNYNNNINDKIKKLPNKFTSEQQLSAELPAIILDLAKEYKRSLLVDQLKNIPTVKDDYLPIGDNYTTIYSDLFNVNLKSTYDKLQEVLTVYWNEFNNYIGRFINDVNEHMDENSDARRPYPNRDIIQASLDTINGFITPYDPSNPDILGLFNMINDEITKVKDEIDGDFNKYPPVIKLFNNFINEGNNIMSVALLKGERRDKFLLVTNNLAYINDTINPDNNIYNLNINGFNELQVFLEWYHQQIYNKLTEDSANPETPFNKLLTKFQNDNDTINKDVSRLSLLKSLNNAIRNTFIDMVNLVINSVSNKVVRDKLSRNNNPEFDKILELIQNRLQKRALSTRINPNNYYLDENYTNGEPIDKLPCVNNNSKLIKLLRNTIHVNIIEYSDLIFKLGISEVLTIINNNNKITKKELNDYLFRHDEKFKSDIDNILNEQVTEDLTKNQLDFFKQFTIINGSMLLNINETNYKNSDVYDDLIGNQEKANKYISSKIKIQLNDLFDKNIIPNTREFLNYYISNTLDGVLDYTKLRTDLQPIIDDIMYYHLQLIPEYPNKIDDSKTLDNIIQSYSNLFLDKIDETTKVTIVTNYNEKFRNKLVTHLTITSQYYLNIYRNQLRYIFNKERYSKLLANFP